jgi:methylphosphotriester-DNA--protein-cysteine methyltransferase
MSASTTARFDFFSAVPRAPLDLFVESIWAVRGDAPYRRSVVLPNGALQLMVNFGAPHAVIGQGSRGMCREFRAAWIAGLQDAPLTIESPARSDLLSIRFRPGGAHAFLPVPLAALTNDVVHAADVLGPAAAELRERLVLASSRAAQVQAAEAWLQARFRPRERDFAWVSRALAALNEPPSQGRRPPVASACNALGLSNRHLIHVFRNLVGLPPKTMARVQRFHAALRRLPAEKNRAALALDLGYADQSHFNNEFRRIAGVTPGAFMERRGEDGESLILG